MISSLFIGRSLFDRYVFKSLAVTLCVTAIVLAAIILLTQSLKFLELIIEAGASSGTFWLLTIMALPRFFEVILPIATMIACLFIYNRLNSDSEVIVMRAAGYAPLDLARPALSVAIYVSLILLLITTWLAPTSLSNMQTMRDSIKQQYSSLLLREGVFNQIGKDLTVYVHSKNSAGELEGLVIHDSRENLEAPVTVLAEKGAIMLSDEGQKVLVYNGSRQDFSNKNGALNRLDFEQYSIEFPQEQDMGLRWKEPDERTFIELLNPSTTLKKDVESNRAFTVEAHKRILAPFLSVTYAVITLSLLLLGPLNRRGQGRRVTSAVIIVTVLQGLFLANVNKAAGSDLSLIAMYLVVFVPMGIGLFMLSGFSEKQRYFFLFKGLSKGLARLRGAS